MFGKHFDSMYSGSLVGSGAIIFAVMGYVIANQRPDRTVGSQVELNSKLLAMILGEPQKKVQEAIEKLCEKDKDSRTEKEGGRRLIKIGQFSYQVVNGAKYLAIRDEETRREQNRESKRRERARVGKPLSGEFGYCEAEKRGASHDELDKRTEPRRKIKPGASGFLD